MSDVGRWSAHRNAGRGWLGVGPVQNHQQPQMHGNSWGGLGPDFFDARLHSACVGLRGSWLPRLGAANPGGSAHRAGDRFNRGDELLVNEDLLGYRKLGGKGAIRAWSGNPCPEDFNCCSGGWSWF